MMTTTKVAFSDVAGLKAAKEVLFVSAVLPIQQPLLFTGARAQRKGVLLYGPPGTGKSYLANAVATEAGATCFSVSPADIKSKWMGEAEQTVKYLFEMAREKAPSIVFIDEIDSLAASRSDNGESDCSQGTLAQLLIEMDGRVGRDNGVVLVIGATNRPWNIDSAIRRRFERRVFIPLPNNEARTAMFCMLLRDTMSDIQQAGFVEMGDQTEGFSGSDIKDIVDNGVLERCLMSTHFKYVAGIDSRGKAHSNMLTPCSMGDSGAMEMTYNEVPRDRLLPPPVTLEDFQRVIRRSRSSVSQDELQKYVQWTADFGRNGS
jgi:vacuolar protein-sorting-associated protein 4